MYPSEVYTVKQARASLLQGPEPQAAILALSLTADPGSIGKVRLGLFSRSCRN
jgi:hypothetical protein